MSEKSEKRHGATKATVRASLLNKRLQALLNNELIPAKSLLAVWRAMTLVWRGQSANEPVSKAARGACRSILLSRSLP